MTSPRGAAACGSSWRTWPALPASVDYAPGGALHETDESFTVELDLPGVDKKNISIDMSDRRLTVHGERVVKERRACCGTRRG